MNRSLQELAIKSSLAELSRDTLGFMSVDGRLAQGWSCWLLDEPLHRLRSASVNSGLVCK